MTRAMIALALLWVLHAPIARGDENRTVSVDGNGEIVVEPDIARVDLAVSIFSKDLRAAKQEADKAIASLLEVMRRLKVADDDVTATTLQVIPRFDYDDDEYQFIGYEIARSMTVIFRQPKRLDELLDASIEAGANRIDEIELESSKEDELKKKALALAITDAKEKARTVATGFGANVGQVQKVDVRDGGSLSLVTSSTGGVQDAAYKPAKIKISASIYAVFDLE